MVVSITISVLGAEIRTDRSPPPRDITKSMSSSDEPDGDEPEADIETYTPNDDNLVDERLKNYLEYKGELARAYEIADAIESTPDYARRRCNVLVEDGDLEKEYGAQVIGHPMPGDGTLKVLVSDWDALLGIVKQFGTEGQYLQALKKGSVQELRQYIENKVVIGDGRPLGTNKVYFGPAE
jgi:hypothetical protein